MRSSFPRLPGLLVGLVLFGLGIAMMAQANLGLGPWEVFHQGIARMTGLQLGTVSILLGIPILLAGNAGKPRVQSWETVMARAPQRAIRYRLRPKTEWWSKKLRPEPAVNRTAPPLFAMF